MPNRFFDDDEPWLDKSPDPPAVRQKRGDRLDPPLWVIHMSHHPVAAARGLKEGFICVGWVEAGDLRLFPGQEELKGAFNKYYPGENPRRIANWAGDARRFLMEMDRGHLFVFPVTGQNQVHIGQIVSDYRFAADDAELVQGDSASIRAVRWLATVPRDAFSTTALECFDSEHTVHSGKDHREEVLSVLAKHGVTLNTNQVP